MRTLAEWRAYRDKLEAALESVLADDVAISITIGDRTLTRPQPATLRREIDRANFRINELESGGRSLFARTVRMAVDDGS